MNKENSKSYSNHGWWVAAILLLLAGSFLLDIWGEEKIIRKHELAQWEDYGTDPVRDPFAAAEMTKAGYKFNCNNCHEHIKSPKTVRKLMAEHQNIVLKHEQAMNCYTCHSREDREMLNDIYGHPVSFEESEQLCRRCHGPRYRDWKLGIHGRPHGYWDETKGERVNFSCVYCHNPHAPKFQTMKASPAPHRDNYIINGQEDASHHE